MPNTQITINQLMIYLTIANIVLGILFGTFPLICGIKLSNRKYGVIGFVGAIIGGGILGIFLSFPVALIFTWLILKDYVVGKPGEAGAVGASPAETAIGDTENI